MTYLLLKNLQRKPSIASFEKGTIGNNATIIIRNTRLFGIDS